MRKREYMKPGQRVVQVHYMTMLFSGSDLRSTNTNLEPEYDFDIDENEPAGDGFWGR